jgi:hypothetical protein
MLQQRKDKLKAKRGEEEVFEVNTTIEIDWEELRRVGAECVRAREGLPAVARSNFVTFFFPRQIRAREHSNAGQQGEVT